MNLIYQLQCSDCKFFFTLEKRAVPFLALCMDTISPPQYRTQTYQLPFTHNPTNSVSKNAGLLVSYTNCQTPTLTTFATNLKQHTNPSSNHVAPLYSTSINPSRPSSIYNLSSVFSVVLLKKVTVLVQKLLLCFLSTLCRLNDANQLSRSPLSY